MVVPFIISVSREVLLTVPREQREAALALGATRWEATWQVVVPWARTGIMGSVFLALARALGETMAVTMVIGNDPKISASLFASRLHDRRGDRQRVHGSHRRSVSQRAHRARPGPVPDDVYLERSRANSDRRHRARRRPSRMNRALAALAKIAEHRDAHSHGSRRALPWSRYYS